MTCWPVNIRPTFYESCLWAKRLDCILCTRKFFFLALIFGSNKDYPAAKLTLNFNPGSSFLGSKVFGAWCKGSEKGRSVTSLFHGSKISGSQLVSVSKDDGKRQRDRQTMIGLCKQNNNFARALGLFNISKPSLHDCDVKLRNLISGARPLYE